MKHERGIVGLWRRGIPLYWSAMTKTLYNLRLLGDRPMTGGAFDAFMDGFGSSMDVFPTCRMPKKSRSADRLWDDFVRIAIDANKGLERAKTVSLKIDSDVSRQAPHIEPAPLRSVRAG